MCTVDIQYTGCTKNPVDNSEGGFLLQRDDKLTIKMCPEILGFPPGRHFVIYSNLFIQKTVFGIGMKFDTELDNEQFYS